MQTEKRDLILKTTLELIAQQSIQATPMSQIGKVSGVATGTIYHHFASKEHIIQEIYLSIKQDFQKIISEYLHSYQTTKQNFDSVWLAIQSYYFTHPNHFLFLQQVTHSPAIDEQTRLQGESYYASILEFFDSGIKLGTFRPMNTHIMAELIHGTIETCVELQLQHPENAEDFKQTALEFAWNAVKQIH